VLELKANPHQPAQGIILEAKLDKGRGPLFTALIKEGTLRVGDFLLSGVQCGKVKALTNEHSKMIKEVTPGFAVEVLGLEGVPTAGDLLFSPETEEKMRSISKNRLDTSKRKAAISTGKISLDDLFSKIQSGDLKELNVLIKADMMGSAEVIRDSLNKLSNPQVKIKVLLSAAGGISESDVLLASASKAIIIGFNVRPESKARQLAEAENIEIKTYNIIYELLDEVKKSMIGLLDKKKVEKFLGRAEVRQVFQVPKAGAVAGCFIIEGKMIRGCQVRLLRDSRVLFEGKMSSLKRFKDDAKEVLSGFECGISLENYNDIKPSDVIEGYFFEYLTPEMKSL
jgi:translation initiation factor IF-2